MSNECLLCRELTGIIPVPGGFLWEDDVIVAFHMPPEDEIGRPRPYLGHLQIVTRRHVARLGDLTDQEGASVGRAATHLAHALREAAGAEWVYSAVIGHGVPHFHQHLFPRYPSTPPDLPWHAVDDAGPHGGAGEIEELVGRMRARLESS